MLIFLIKKSNADVKKLVASYYIIKNIKKLIIPVNFKNTANK